MLSAVSSFGLPRKVAYVAHWDSFKGLLFFSI
jgi:hypothetical protein